MLDEGRAVPGGSIVEMSFRTLPTAHILALIRRLR
jgi:hypothetical protein